MVASQGHDLLDFYNTAFERDFVEFTMKNSGLSIASSLSTPDSYSCSGLENAIQDFIEHSLTSMSNIDKRLDFMKKFQVTCSR